MIEELLRSTIGMSAEQLDELPFGAIVVDVYGTILRYNKFESQMSHLDAKRVIGKNFFRDIAPCAAVAGFGGRLTEFSASHERVSVTFDFRFAFAHGTVDVAVTFIKVASDDVLIAVDRIDSKADAVV
jgi:photoactive yellow protein